MKRLLAVLVLSGLTAQAQTITETFGSGENQFSIDFAEVGNPTGAGVGYVYRLGVFEVSRDIILKATTSGALGITLQNNGFGPNKPATGISWYEAAVFVNWLNTSRGHQPAYKFGGVSSFGNPLGYTDWSPSDSGYNSNNKMRNAAAKFFLPSSAEWYWGSMGTPSGALSNISWIPVAGGTDPGTAVYRQGGPSPADVTNAGGLNDWGIMGMVGNVWEWNEDRYKPVNFGGIDAVDGARMAVGADWGAWYTNEGLNSPPNFEGGGSSNYGFRVAMVPEPSSLSLLLAGGAVLAAARRRRLV